MGERPRIRDVAHAAGTSITTVSNLLNGRAGRMRPETVSRIEEAIEHLGYRPSWAARQLRTGFVPILGLVVPSVGNPYHGAFAGLVEEEARARGYQVLLCNSLRDPERERQYGENLLSFGIRGMIIGTSPPDLAHFDDLIRRGLAIVAADRVAATAGGTAKIDSFHMDNRRAGYLATRHLLDLGHRRIGYVSGATQTLSRQDRLEGYRQALAEARLECDPALIASEAAPFGFDDAHAAERGCTAARSLLEISPPITALVCFNDMHAFGACAAVRAAGGAVPADMSVVGIDDIMLAGLVDPPLTTVRQPFDAMAVAATEQLIKRVQGEAEGPPQHRTFAPELVVRGSTASPRGAGARRRPAARRPARA